MNWLFSSSAAKRSTCASPDISVEPIFDASPLWFPLYPNAADRNNTTNVSGRFLITLFRTEALRAMSLRMLLCYDVGLGDLKENGEVEVVSCMLQSDERLYEAGQHFFPFVLQMPNTAPPITFANAQSGHKAQYKLRYRLEIAFTRGTSPESTRDYRQRWPESKKATFLPPGNKPPAIGVKKNLIFSVSPGQPGELPSPTSLTIDCISDKVGVVRAVLTSRYFMVGGLYNFTLDYGALNPGVTLQEVRLYIRETNRWTSPSPTGVALPDDITKHQMAALHTVPGEVALSHQGRLPKDDFISCSTLLCTKSPLRISHDLLVELAFRDATGSKLVASMAQPIMITGCDIIAERINLPTYGSHPIPLKEFQPESEMPDKTPDTMVFVHCACGFTMDMLRARETEGITAGLDLPSSSEMVTTKSREAREAMS